MRLVLLHGFTLTGAAWAPIVAALDADAVTPDLPGHGGDPVPRSVSDTAAALAAADPRPAIWVGYSLGGRVALRLAIDHPEVVAGLVLISTTAGIEDRAERAARKQADDALADHIEQVPIEQFIDEWLAGPLWRTLPAAARSVELRRTNTPAGLAGSLRLAGTGVEDPAWDRLPLIHCPTLIITGMRDEKFTALGARLHTGIRDSERVELDGGHAVPWERPAETAAAVRTFSGRQGRSRA